MLEARKLGRKEEKSTMKVCIYLSNACKMTDVTRHGDDIHSHQEAVEKVSLTGRGEPITGHLKKPETK